MTANLSSIFQPTRANLTRGLCFAFVGLLGMALDTLLLWFLTARVGLFYLLSATVAAEITVLFNFMLHSVLTFSSIVMDRPFLHRLYSYHAVATGGILFAMAVLAVLHSAQGVPYLLANLVAISCASAWNYLMSTTWVWRAARPACVIATGEGADD